MGGKLKLYGFNNLTRGDAFYRPMLEVVDYLLDNEFIVYNQNRFRIRYIIEVEAK